MAQTPRKSPTLEGQLDLQVILPAGAVLRWGGDSQVSTVPPLRRTLIGVTP